MDIDRAILAHSEWKLKLNSLANGTYKDKIDSSAVGKDNLCELGKWIYGEGKAVLASKPEFNELIKVHAEFHKNAAALVQQVERGQAAEVKKILNDASSPYCKCSLQVVGLLMKLKTKMT